jgi:TfoX/Sxy family transcriptional regulator of competence genes
MPKELISDLEKVLAVAADGLAKITNKKMFGCYALWANGNVFALVWKHGRIGLKLSDEKSYQALMSLSGSAPWKAGPMQMAHWVLVPESFHQKSSDLKHWAAKAHAQCLVLEKKAKPAAASKKKVSGKKVKGKAK